MKEIILSLLTIPGLLILIYLYGLFSYGYKKKIQDIIDVIKDNNFDTIVTEHRYETSNKKKPKIQNCYAEKRRNTSEKLVLNLGKYINTSFKNDYSNENALNLSSTQWNNYLTYCQWF